MGLAPYKKGDTARGEISADSFLKEATKWGMDLEIVDVYEVVNNKLLDGYRARYSLIEDWMMRQRQMNDFCFTEQGKSRFLRLYHKDSYDSLLQIKVYTALVAIFQSIPNILQKKNMLNRMKMEFNLYLFVQ